MRKQADVEEIAIAEDDEGRVLIRLPFPSEFMERGPSGIGTRAWFMIDGEPGSLSVHSDGNGYVTAFRVRTSFSPPWIRWISKNLYQGVLPYSYGDSFASRDRIGAWFEENTPKDVKWLVSRDGFDVLSLLGLESPLVGPCGATSWSGTMRKQADIEPNEDMREPTEFSVSELGACRLYLDDEGAPRCMDCHETWDSCDQPEPGFNGAPLLSGHELWPEHNGGAQ